MKNLVKAGVTSFGERDPSAGGDFGARTFLNSDRYRELDRRQSYYNCTQHDWKSFDFDGRAIAGEGGGGITQPFLSTAKYAQYVPLRQRRPSSPYRLPRVITNAFTSLIFGEGRFPKFRVEGDSQTEDFVQTCVKVMQMPTKMIQARNLGGSVGSVGLSWCYYEGRPRMQVHNTKNVFVHSWEDREMFIPRWVTEIYQYPKTEWDPRRKRYVKNLYWYRRDWTPNEDVLFEPILVEAGREPGVDVPWTPDVRKSVHHGDGLTHFTWIQNLPCEDPDGLPDYDGLYENFDTLDLLLSVITKGATLNLDPTVKLKMDPMLVEKMGIKKGSDNALVVGETGDADYMELGGQSIEAGINLFNAKRGYILEVAECVIPDPNEIAASGTSSVALKVIYAPMLGKGNLLRDQYGGGGTRLLEPVVVVGRKASKSRVILFADDGTPVEAIQELDLPKKVVQEPEMDELGEPTGEQTTTFEERVPGPGGDIEPAWGPYFVPTPQDQQLQVTTLSTAAGNQPIMSQQTAAELAATIYNRDPQEEYARLTKEGKENEAKQAQMFSPFGGEVDEEGELPEGATPRGGGKPNPFAKGGGGGLPGAGKPPGLNKFGGNKNEEQELK